MNLTEIREQGLLEAYALGDVEPSQTELIEKALINSPDIRKELHDIEECLKYYASQRAIEPHPTQKPLLMSTLSYILRLQAGENLPDPPALDSNSKISDYKLWLEKENLQEPEKYDAMHGHIIGATEEKSTLIVWLIEGAPDETHTDELESFLIVEGTCEITIGNEVHSLKAGDVLSIPLHINHNVKVTSRIPCKVILERKAA